MFRIRKGRKAEGLPSFQGNPFQSGVPMEWGKVGAVLGCVGA